MLVKGYIENSVFDLYKIVDSVTTSHLLNRCDVLSNYSSSIILKVEYVTYIKEDTKDLGYDEVILLPVVYLK